MKKSQLIENAAVMQNEMKAFQRRVLATEGMLSEAVANEYFLLKRKVQLLDAEMMSAGDDPQVFEAYVGVRQTLNKFQRFNHIMRAIVEKNSNDERHFDDRR